MTEYNLQQDRLPPASVFLNTMCPGVPFLDDNTHFSVSSLRDKSRTKIIELYNWPLSGLISAPTILATLQDTYLHVARPPYEQDDYKNMEPSTYVPLPLHITSLFTSVVEEIDDRKNPNNLHLHIGANVSPLVHDPFRLVLLNPGCLSSMIRFLPSAKPNIPLGGVREPLNKMATSINHFLCIGSPELSECEPYFHSLTDHMDCDAGSRKAVKDSPFSHFVDFDPKHYQSQLSSPAVSKLLVSANVNVLNVFALNAKCDYNNTSTIVSTSLLFPQLVPTCALTLESSANRATSNSSVPAYSKVVEKAILRIQLKSTVVVTSIHTLNNEPTVILGLSSGEIVYINLSNLTYRHFSDLGVNEQTHDIIPIAIPNPVTSLNTVLHPTRNLLLFAGFASGEVMIIDPVAPASTTSLPYRKVVVGEDRFVTVFKKFDLSFAARKYPEAHVDDIGPPYIVGHFKLSHKPITSIASTLSHDIRVKSPSIPMILAIASEDGLVRFIDLIATHGKNYGNPENFYNALILTDMISSYFQDGVRFIEFSPDFRFLCVCGKGDAIEIFKMSYYNVNGLLKKNSESTKKYARSRSDTVNSVTSNTHDLLNFSPPISSNTSQTFDSHRDDGHEARYPPVIKDIVIVSRFRAHANTVERVVFVKADSLHQTKNKAGHDVYNLISCGRDGHVMVWELNTKALPKAKKSHILNNYRNQYLVSEKRAERNLSMMSENTNAVARGFLVGLSSNMKHQRNRSITSHDDAVLGQNFSALCINNLLSFSSPQVSKNDNIEEQNNIVNSLYRSLHELRLRKHYGKQDIKHKYQCVIHGIVDDKELPIMRIPLLIMDLSYLIKEGSISGLHLATNDFWVFGNTGDIFRYKIE